MILINNIFTSNLIFLFEFNIENLNYINYSLSPYININVNNSYIDIYGWK